VLDGVYGNLDAADIAGTPDERPPSPAALAPITPITRILRRLTRLGHLVEEDGQTTLAGGWKGLAKTDTMV